ncbi:Toll-like receptor Tollo like protein [Argiope bruennichi]|uniref:Toll-like receptor Tollo like protein n=1 Tax=Argiope bruennichi TaxID=94029 RepID=A0A8T0F4T7_ARGBR|nr:Toll-like receptor Tollo like protein [Argiope bruennichi]
MDYWRNICVLLLLVLSSSYLNTESCSIKETSKNVSCFCDLSEETLSGWTYTCIDSIPFEPLYAVTYVADQSITFQCGEHEPHYQSILQQVELGQIQTFQFQSCSLPNTSFSEIIPYREKYPVEQIIIKDKRDDKLFTANLFGNISSSLKSLSLSGNNIDTLPESLFSNFSRLKFLSLSDNRMWFQVEFRTAYYQMLEDKIDRLIIIVKGELPPKDTLDKDLQYLLSTKTYLIWEEKWFWEKLRYAMPHKKQQLVPNDVLALRDRPASEKVKSVDNQIAILSANGRKSGKGLELVQNHTSSTMNLVKKDSSNKY